MSRGPSFDPRHLKDMEASAEESRAIEQQKAALDRERSRQEDLLIKDAIRLLKKDRIKLDDISETFIFRKLLTSAFSTSATERQWSVQQLMGLKGMKVARSKQTAAVEDDERMDILSKLRASG